MDALDRELAHALAVDPSPEFVARVRARVANEPAPSSWRMPRLLMAAGAVAVVIVAVAVVGPRPQEPVAVHAVRPAVSAAPIIEAVPPPRPVRRRRVRRSPAPIQLVSIADMPTAPIGAVAPAMTFDDVVTMTGVHP